MNTERMLTGIAEILEVPAVTEDSVLAEVGSWDSLAIVCTIALIDEVGGQEVTGVALMDCKTVADVIALAKGREAQTIGADEVRDVGDLFQEQKL